MTYRPHAPWITHAMLIEKRLGDRIKYVRTNLRDEEDKRLTQPVFAVAVGLASGHHGIVRWERHDAEPQEETRQRIAELTPYPASSFTRLGAEGVSLESIDARLRDLEAAVAKMPTQEDLTRGLDTLRAAIDARANLGKRRGSAGQP